MKKVGKTLLIVLIVSAIAIWLIYCALCIFADGTLPKLKLIYFSYDTFREDSMDDFFMDSLPESASHKRYFHQVYLFNQKNGYRVVIDEAGYENAKKQCLQSKWDYINWLTGDKSSDGESVIINEERKEKHMSYIKYYSMEDTSKTEPDMEELFEKYGVDFWDFLAGQEIEDGNYHFIWCMEDDISYYSHFNCAIYNDETHEIIEISSIREKLW